MDTLISSEIEGEFYKINMFINRENDKLCFFINSTIPDPQKHISIHRYKVYIQVYIHILREQFYIKIGKDFISMLIRYMKYVSKLFS